LFRAAPAGAGAQCAGLRRQGQVDAHYLVPGVHRAGGCHRGVHPAAHRGQDLHSTLARLVAAFRDRATTGSMASSTSATSAPVVVRPSEKRSEARAAAGVAPIASNTWEGCATPAVHAAPVEH